MGNLPPSARTPAVDFVAALAEAAWAVRERSRLIGKTAVGCAVMTEEGDIYAGCNVEHQFRSHDIHAEVNALSNMVAGTSAKAVAVFVAAAREKFTPCGACLDWVFELSTPECVVFVQKDPSTPPSNYSLGELMPHYPR
jgi:cytidine deaminase